MKPEGEVVSFKQRIPGPLHTVYVDEEACHSFKDLEAKYLPGAKEGKEWSTTTR